MVSSIATLFRAKPARQSVIRLAAGLSGLLIGIACLGLVVGATQVSPLLGVLLLSGALAIAALAVSMLIGRPIRTEPAASAVVSEEAASTPVETSVRLTRSMPFDTFAEELRLMMIDLGYRAAEPAQTLGQPFAFMLRRGGVLFGIGLRSWRSLEVAGSEIRLFMGAVESHPAPCKGLFVTLGHFSDEAVQIALENGIELIDGDELAAMRLESDALRTQPASEDVSDSDVVEADAPCCPVCEAKMIRRRYARGSRKGKLFWGCTNYPNCRCRVEDFDEAIELALWDHGFTARAA